MEVFVEFEISFFKVEFYCVVVCFWDFDEFDFMSFEVCNGWENIGCLEGDVLYVNVVVEFDIFFDLRLFFVFCWFIDRYFDYFIWRWYYNWFESWVIFMKVDLLGYW